LIGKNADDRNNNGMRIRFIIDWNPSKSCIFEAIINPNPTAVKDNNIIMRIVNSNPPMFMMGTPRASAIMRITIPWNNAIVAPPRVLPITIDSLLTGATRTSCKNPNCLSHNTDTPVNIEENIIAIAIIPGARKLIYDPLKSGNVAILNPNPRIKRKNKGSTIVDTILLFARTNRFICRSHMT
jgi:hypothetical protein